MALDLERCSPYKLAVGILIGYFIGRDEDTNQAELDDGWAKRAGRSPTPVHYRILSSVISDQLKAIDRAEEKSLGQLQREIREAFSKSHEQGPAMACRVALRLSAVRYPDDLVDLVTWLGALMEETQSDEDEQQVNQSFGDRPRRLQPNSVFGVFIRRLVAGCDGGSFRRLSTLYEEVVRFVGGAVREPESSSNGGASDDDDDSDMEMDLDSPTNLTGGRGSGPIGGFSTAGLGDLGLGEGQEQGGIVGAGGSGAGHINTFLKQRQLLKGRQALAGRSQTDERSSRPGVGVDLSGGDLSFEDDFGDDDERDDERGRGVEGGDGGAGVGQVSLSVPPPAAPAAWQLRLHLQNTVLQLEKGLSSQVPFEVVEAEVQAALKAHSDMPMAHFLRLVNCLHHRELQGSLDSLHRYFDYTVRRGGPSAATAEGFPDIARGAEGGSGRHNPQHASLALASLHFQFGHLQLASVALDEAIRVAQQSGDKVCVAQALGWLYQILAAQGHPRAGDVLRRCASQAADLGLTHLATATALLLAKEAAVARNGSNLAASSSHSAHQGGGLHTLGGSAGGTGPSGSPAPSATGSLASGAPSASTVSLRRGGPAGFTSPKRIWECLEAASCGNVRGLLDSEGVGSGTSDGIAGVTVGGAGANNGRGFVEVAGGTGGEGAGALACQRLLVEAAAFERFGYSEMAVACSRTVLQVFAKFASASDVEVATACIINAILRGKCLTGAGFVKTPEDIPPSAGTRQRHVGNSRYGERSRASSQPQQVSGAMDARSGADLGSSEGKEACVYEVALALALRQHEAFPHPVSNLWAGGVMVLLHEWMVNRGELTAAEGLGMSLRGCCPLSRGAEAFVEAHLQRVRLLRAQGRWQEAVRAASALAKLCDTRGLAPQYARLLLELSRVRLGAEPSSPVGALPHALRCLAVCESYSLDAIHASAMIHLAEVHLRLGSTRRARILLRACLGHLLVNASVQTQGEAWLAMAKCEVAELSLAAGNGDPDRERSDRQAGFGGDVRDEEAGAGGKAPGSGQGGGLRRAVECLDRAIGLFKRCHDFARLRECWCLKARVCAELALQGSGDVADEALRERNKAAEALLAVLEAGARALAAPSPGLRIGPAEVLKYSTRAMSQVPWVR